MLALLLASIAAPSALQASPNWSKIGKVAAISSTFAALAYVGHETALKKIKMEDVLTLSAGLILATADHVSSHGKKYTVGLAALLSGAIAWFSLK